MEPEDRESEEVDVTPFEGEPDFEDSPTRQGIIQDNEGRHISDRLEGEALGDDLAPAQEAPDA